MEKNNEFLSVRDLVVEYTSNDISVHAVNGVSFDIQRGSILGLVGETGAGKTSIAKSIIGVLPDPPAKVKGGQIFLDGTDLLQASESEMLKIRGKRVSMIFQDPMTALTPNMSVGKQIEDAIILHEDLKKNEAKERAKEMLEMVGIPSSRYVEYPHQFSGGMKQRVIIAIALACEPDLLLADEPTTALDVTIQAQILDLIRELVAKRNTSMLLITHDLGVVAEMCNNVAIIYAGQIVEYGSLEEIYRSPRHPYTIGLFGALPSMAGHVRRLNPIAGEPPDPSNLPEGCKFWPRCPYVEDRCKEREPDAYPLGGTHLCKCLRYESGENSLKTEKEE